MIVSIGSLRASRYTIYKKMLLLLYDFSYTKTCIYNDYKLIYY